MWTMSHKTQVVAIAMSHPFNHYDPPDLSIIYSPADKTALPAPETKGFVRPQGRICSAST
jgi:hypothetical protein